MQYQVLSIGMNCTSDFSSRSTSVTYLSFIAEIDRFRKEYFRILPTCDILDREFYEKWIFFQGRRKTTLYPRSHYQTNSRSRRKWNMIFFILKIPLIVFLLWLLKATLLYITTSVANILAPNE